MGPKHHPFESHGVADAVLTSVQALIGRSEYGSLDGYRAYSEKLSKDLKFLSEVLTCLHFSSPEHPLTQPLLARLREIILHRHMLQAVRFNPLLATWLLNAVAFLQDHFLVERERRFAIALVDSFGLDPLDAPSYRLEENKYQYAKLRGSRYIPDVGDAFDRNFYHLSRDQVYALTHLLFYASDYGTAQFSCSPERRFALEHLTFDSYVTGDIDVMLELMLVHRASEERDDESVTLFEQLLMKRVSEHSRLLSAMTDPTSPYFREHYHQCLLMVMYCEGGRLSGCDSKFERAAYRARRAAHAFHVSLRSPNFVKAAQAFTRLAALDPARHEFCRANLNRYFALQRYDLE